MYAKENIDSKKTELKTLVLNKNTPWQGRFFGKTLQSSLSKGGRWGRWVGVIVLQDLVEQQAKKWEGRFTSLSGEEKQRK